MTKRSAWFAVEATVETEAAEAAEFALNELGAAGTSYSLLAKPDKPFVVVTGYFESPRDLAAAETKVIEALDIYGFRPEVLSGIESGWIEDQDWLAEWKKHWKPTVTEKFVVAPPWDEGDHEGKIVIRIEPGMAFGTGTHETTRLCLREIERRFERGMSFLDVGTGTGILAIAADMLSGGGSGVSACDTDADAVKIAVENARLNGAQGIAFRTGSVTPDTPEADFVCANLTTDTIKPILALLAGKAGKVLVLSGVLDERKEEIADALKSMDLQPDIRVDGEWVSLTVEK